MACTFNDLLSAAKTNGYTDLYNFAENYYLSSQVSGNTVNMQDFLESLKSKGNNSLVLQASATWDNILGKSQEQAYKDTVSSILSTASSKNYTELYNLVKQYQQDNPENWYEDFNSRIQDYIRTEATGNRVTLMSQYNALALSLSSQKIDTWYSSVVNDPSSAVSTASAQSGSSDAANDGNSAIALAGSEDELTTDLSADTGTAGDGTTNESQSMFYVKNLVTGTTVSFVFTIEDISDSAGASWDTQNVRGRSTPIVGYEGSEQRQINITVQLHRDYFCKEGEDLTTVVNNLKALVYPGYSGYMVIPPTCLLKLGKMVSAAGYMTSVDVSWLPPISDGCYMMADVSLSFSAAPANAYQASDIESGAEWIG